MAPENTAHQKWSPYLSDARELAAGLQTQRDGSGLPLLRAAQVPPTRVTQDQGLVWPKTTPALALVTLGESSEGCVCMYVFWAMFLFAYQ